MTGINDSTERSDKKADADNDFQTTTMIMMTMFLLLL